VVLEVVDGRLPVVNGGEEEVDEMRVTTAMSNPWSVMSNSYRGEVGAWLEMAAASGGLRCARKLREKAR
jgi:hypothetical protein